MRILNGKNNIQKKIEKSSISSAQAANISSAEDEYINAIALKRKVLTIIIIALIGIEGFLAGVLYNVVRHYDLQRRVSREYEIRHSGEIQLKTGIYTGETDFGYFLGTGSFKFNSGESYSGEWNENAYNGLGELKVPSEGKYKGEFSGFEKKGEGTFTWDDGTIYQGQWKNDCMDGHGEYIEPDGVKYSGIFKENAFVLGTCSIENKTGKYTLEYNNGKIDSASIILSDGTHYDGDVDQNMIDGNGKMIFPNQDTYSGSFQEGKRSGMGVYTWFTGESYDGEWSEDQLSGTGKYTYSDGGVLEGTFLNNSFVKGTYRIKNDFGEYLFNFEDGEADVVAIVLHDGTQFVGEIEEGRLNGRAQIKYSNGDTYDGNVKDAMKSGKGKYYWTNGASYDGNWENDEMSGKGTYMYPDLEDGYKLVGSFSNGVPEGDCKYYTDSITSYETTWSNGKCIKVTE